MDKAQNLTVIGLTGPSGSGKNIVAGVFSKHGIGIFDSDSVYHKLLIPPSACSNELILEFGEEILNADGTLNRQRLSEIVFSGEGHEERLAKLNKISHKHVISEFFRWIDEMKEKNMTAVLIDAPLLFESGLSEHCDFIISVLADKEIRLSRIIERDNIPKENAIMRINNQNPDEFYIEKSTFVIENNGLISEVKEATEKVLSEILQKTQERY